MQPVVHELRRVHEWKYNPGMVGSVGATAMDIRLKTSGPDDIRFANTDGYRYGSYLDDGNGSARTIDSYWKPHKKRIANGWRYQDLRLPPVTRETYVKEIPQYSWLSHIATTNKANSRSFEPSPRGYGYDAIKGLPRGGAYPRLVKFVGTDPLPTAQISIPKISKKKK